MAHKAVRVVRLDDMRSRTMRGDVYGRAVEATKNGALLRSVEASGS